MIKKTILLIVLTLSVFSGCGKSDSSVNNTPQTEKGSISGTITISGTKGVPISKVTITTTPTTSVNISNYLGAYSVPDVPVGTYYVHALLVGYRIDSAKVIVEAGKNSEVNISLQSNSTDVNHKPNIPMLSAPLQNATISGSETYLKWSCSDDDAGDVLTYDVYLGTSSSAKILKYSNVSIPQVIVSGLVPGTTYYWKIIAKDESGALSESEIWSFKVL